MTKRPSIEEIRRAINYDPINGTFFWTFEDNVYINVRGKETGTSEIGRAHV